MSVTKPVAALVLIGLGGCVNVPTSETVANAQASLPAAWRSAADEPGADLQTWWDGFADPTLRSLIERALEQNYDLKGAAERARRAQALIRVARSALYPDLNLTAAASRQRSNMPPPAGTSNDAALGTSGSWTIDIFGANQLAALAATAEAEASEEARRDFEVALTANVATVYAELRGLQTQRAILDANIAVRADTLHLTRVRYDAGLATDLDVARAETQLQRLEAEIPEVRRRIDNAVGALAILTGTMPEAVDPSLLVAAPIPGGDPALPQQAPAALLERRPDLREAARRIDAAAAHLGSARADLLPKFTLGFAAYSDRLTFRDMPDVTDGLFQVGLGTFWPLFNAGRIRANIVAADASLRETEHAFDQALLNALQDVETSYTNIQAQRERRALLSDAVESGRRSSRLAQDLYQAGTTDFLSVLDAQTQVFESERALAATQTEAAISAVDLYRSLGGGWRADAATASP